MDKQRAFTINQFIEKQILARVNKVSEEQHEKLPPKSSEATRIDYQ